VGQNTKEQVRADWGPHLAPEALDALTQACGITGQRAEEMAKRLRFSIDIPYDAAIEVFERCTLPRYCALTEKLPNCNELDPHSFGALVSLVFNRGASFDRQGDRYREMRAIKDHMASRAFHLIPNEIRSMKRLWPDLPGLQRRRESEAALFEAGLRRIPPPAEPPKPLQKPKAGVLAALISWWRRK